jgi:tetratricopeptide (TPR) repeat protein
LGYRTGRIGERKIARPTFVFFIIGFSFLQFEGSAKILQNELIDSLKLEYYASEDSLHKFNLLLEISRKYCYADIDTALLYIDSATFYFNENDIYRLAKIKQTTAYAETIKRNPEIALGLYMEAAEGFKELNDSANLGWTYNNIAYIFAMFEDDEKTLKYLIPAKKLIKKDTSRIISLLLFSSVTYMYLGEMDSAISHGNEALELSIKANMAHSKGRALSNLGFLYEELEEYDKALNYYQEGYQFFSSSNNVIRKIEVSINLGYVYSKLKAYRTSAKYFDLAKKWSIENNFLMYLGQIHSGMEQNAVASKNYKDAYTLRKSIIAASDSIMDAASVGEMYELESEFQSKENDSKLKLLQETGAVEDIRIWNKNMLIIALLFMLLPIVIIYRIVKVKLKWSSQRRSMELENEVLQNQMNPHFIFNALNGIQRFYLEGNTDKGNELLLKFSSLIEDVLNNSRKKYVSLKDEIASLDRYLELEQVRTANKFTYFISSSADLDLVNIFIPPLLFQPFVENSIWHGIIPLNKKGRIDITIDQRDDSTLDCKVIDNGIGISQSKKDQAGNIKHESKGLAITRERLGDDGRITYASGRPGNQMLGTVVVLRVPFIKKKRF